MEPNEPNTEKTSSSPKKTKKGKLVALIVIILLLIGGTAAGTYYYRDRQAKDAAKQSAAEVKTLKDTVASLEAQAKSESTPTTTQTTPACTPVRPSASAVENIEASITSGNTAALEGYMATSVNVLYAASDGIGTRTPTQAVSDITSFIGGSTVVWAFNIPAALLSSYGQGSYDQYFPSTAVVGKSSQDRVLSFNFDCNGKISTVFMAAQESTLQ